MVCAVAKLLQITVYPTVIVNQNGSNERKREIIVRRRTNSNLGPFLAWNTRCMLLDVTITIHCKKSVDK